MRFAAALLAGLLAALALPLALPGSGRPLLPASSEVLALVALVPLLVCLRGVRPRAALGWGLLAGVVYFAISLYWLDVALTTFGHLPRLASIPIMALLVAFLGLFWAVALWLSAHLARWTGWAEELLLPVSWTALEWVRNYVLTGFPWASAGSSQVRTLWLAQLASLGGVYLVGFMVVWSNSCLAGLSLWWHGRARLRRWTLAAWLAAMALAAAFGAVRLQAGQAEGARLRVGLVQGNLDERAHLRGPAAQRWVLRRMLAESRRAAARGARLVVWPEATLPDPLPEGVVRLPLPGAAFAGPLPPAMVIGAVLRGYRKGRTRLRNSALLVDEHLRVLGRYHKRHLVPFGEYVPLEDLLPVHWFVPPTVAFFTPGEDHRPRPSAFGELGLLICYEAIFPEIARESVARGARLLVNITNDSWYGPTSAPHQHLALSRMRAIETGRWLVRAANTGISAVIDSRGRLRDVIPLGLAPGGADYLSPDRLRPAASLVAEVRLLEGRTPYVLLGDWFPAACALVVLLGLGRGWWKRRRQGAGGKGAPESPGLQ